MDREARYERREAVARMHTNMVIVAGVAVLAAVLALFQYGWLPSLGLLILGGIAFGLSQVFDLLGEVLASMDSGSKRAAPPAREGAQHESGDTPS